MAHYVSTCGVDHPTSEGRIICGMEYRKENRTMATGERNDVADALKEIAVADDIREKGTT